MRVSDRRGDNGSWAEVESGELRRSRMFEDVNTRSILDRVPAKLRREAARSLWRRIDSELQSGGPREVISYLRSQFNDIATEFRSEISAVKEIE